MPMCIYVYMYLCASSKLFHSFVIIIIINNSDLDVFLCDACARGLRFCCGGTNCKLIGFVERSDVFILNLIWKYAFS